MKVDFRNNNHSVVCEGTLLPHPEAIYYFTSESEECFQHGSQIPFFAKYPVLQTTLIVHYDMARLDVYLDLSFGDSEKDAICTDLTTGKKWTFRTPMLPGQGFVIRMARKPSTPGAVSGGPSAAVISATPPPTAPHPPAPTPSVSVPHATSAPVPHPANAPAAVRPHAGAKPAPPRTPA